MTARTLAVELYRICVHVFLIPLMYMLITGCTVSYVVEKHDLDRARRLTGSPVGTSQGAARATPTKKPLEDVVLPATEPNSGERRYVRFDALEDITPLPSGKKAIAMTTDWSTLLYSAGWPIVVASFLSLVGHAGLGSLSGASDRKVNTWLAALVAGVGLLVWGGSVDPEVFGPWPRKGWKKDGSAGAKTEESATRK